MSNQQVLSRTVQKNSTARESGFIFKRIALITFLTLSPLSFSQNQFFACLTPKAENILVETVRAKSKPLFLFSKSASPQFKVQKAVFQSSGYAPSDYEVWAIPKLKAYLKDYYGKEFNCRDNEIFDNLYLGICKGKFTILEDITGLEGDALISFVWHAASSYFHYNNTCLIQESSAKIFENHYSSWYNADPTLRVLIKMMEDPYYTWEKFLKDLPGLAVKAVFTVAGVIIGIFILFNIFSSPNQPGPGGDGGWGGHGGGRAG
ncbi:hypothetical protein FJZ26_00555 [Candidatus Parvarchaeota archaeon]|nr:hypothetical protein [Candidatus Parvarchaeota archaeon]